jgi:hypothetical protein
MISCATVPEKVELNHQIQGGEAAASEKQYVEATETCCLLWNSAN